MALTGLDPAGPFFENAWTKYRLDQSDADFVDVIHTNGKALAKGGMYKLSFPFVIEKKHS